MGPNETNYSSLGKHAGCSPAFSTYNKGRMEVDGASFAVSTINDVQLTHLWPIRVPGAHPVGVRDG